MKKKVFTLLTLLLMAVTGAWATDFVLSAETATEYQETGKPKTFVSNGQTFTIAKGSTPGVAGEVSSLLLKLSKNATYTIGLPTGFTITAINFKGYTNKNNATCAIDKVNGSDTDWEAFPNNTVASTESSWGNHTYDITGSDQKASTVTFHVANTEQINVVITITGTATPRLTGAWSAASGTIYQGDDVPTPSFSVTNEPAPTASAYSVAYSLKAGSDDGVAEITGGGAGFTLNNSVVGSATIVATLTSKDTENYLDAAETYEYAYEVKAKTPAIELTEDEVTLKSTPVSRDASTTVDLTGAFLNDGTGSVTWTAVDGLTISPTSFDIASGSATQTFTITYNKDAATSGSVDVTFSDGTTSKVLTVNYSSVVPHTWATVSATTTWDWSGTTSVTIPENESTPYGISRNSEDINLADFDGEVYNDNANLPAGFDALLASKFQNPSNGTGYQGTVLKFKTTVPGTLEVEFSNTGGGDRPYRYLYVNGTQTAFKSNSTTKVTATDIVVPAGVIEIKGVMDPESSDTKAGTDQFLRIYKVTFTESDGSITQEAVNITCEGGLASYVNYDNDLDFSTSTAKAYIVTATSASSVTLTEVKKVAKGTGIIIAGGAKGDVINVLTTDEMTTDEKTDIVNANLLKATAASTGTTVGANEAYGLSKADGKFHKLNAGTIPAGKAYLSATAFGGGAPEIADLDFNGNSDITTGISTIEHLTSTIEHSAFYNLSGQRVSQPTKGLYIVNGKKVVIK